MFLSSIACTAVCRPPASICLSALLHGLQSACNVVYHTEASSICWSGLLLCLLVCNFVVVCHTAPIRRSTPIMFFNMQALLSTFQQHLIVRMSFCLLFMSSSLHGCLPSCSLYLSVCPYSCRLDCMCCCLLQCSLHTSVCLTVVSSSLHFNFVCRSASMYRSAPVHIL